MRHPSPALDVLHTAEAAGTAISACTSTDMHTHSNYSSHTVARTFIVLF